jgi:hypothetical protein
MSAGSSFSMWFVVMNIMRPWRLATPSSALSRPEKLMFGPVLPPPRNSSSGTPTR